MAVKLGKMWHEQPEKDKDMYKKKAAQLRRRYRRRWADEAGTRLSQSRFSATQDQPGDFLIIGYGAGMVQVLTVKRCGVFRDAHHGRKLATHTRNQPSSADIAEKR
ncbi:hypothetical protein Q9233_012394 [Columba guinea]|nr:hypothetical protein Q9233_012394 [Columba guinea]